MEPYSYTAYPSGIYKVKYIGPYSSKNRDGCIIQIVARFSHKAKEQCNRDNFECNAPNRDICVFLIDAIKPLCPKRRKKYLQAEDQNASSIAMCLVRKKEINEK